MRPILALLLVGGVALADSRPPMTTGVYFGPGDARSIYVRATFGLLLSHDDGCSFRWACERAIGYSGGFDPKYAVAADGSIFATTFEGLRVTRDGCNWTTAPVGPGKIWVDAIDIGPSGDVWVATAESAGANDVYRSTDNGVTFAARGLRSGAIWWKSVKAARSNGQVVYVTGYQVAPAPKARLDRSDDAGRSWKEHPLTGVRFGATPIVLVVAVDPADPDQLLLVSLEANPPRGDRLYRSVDGGVTFTQVLATTDRIRDVFYAADGSVYAATLGAGAFRSTNRGADWQPLAGTPQLGCLGQRGDGTFVACGANWEPDDKAIARSSDATAWQPVFRFVELAGPLQCPAGTTVGDRCAAAWPALQTLFGATGPTATCAPVPDGAPRRPPPKRGCCDAGGSASPLVVLVAILLGRRRYRPSRQLL